MRFAPVAWDYWLAPDDPAGYEDMVSPDEEFRRKIEENAEALKQLFKVPSNVLVNPQFNTTNTANPSPFRIIGDECSAVFKNMGLLIKNTGIIDFIESNYVTTSPGAPLTYHTDLAVGSPRSGGMAGLPRAIPNLTLKTPVPITPGASFQPLRTTIKILPQPP